ncbi:MAG TPA: 30S ribosomal protein S20 [Anaerolineales bacterium]
MPNIKSAIKRMKQNEKRRIRNRYFRGRARALVRDARTAIESGDLDQAREATIKAASALDKAAVKGILHENNASRRKGRLMQQLADLEKNLAE